MGSRVRFGGAPDVAPLHVAYHQQPGVLGRSDHLLVECEPHRSKGLEVGDLRLHRDRVLRHGFDYPREESSIAGRHHLRVRRLPFELERPFDRRAWGTRARSGSSPTTTWDFLRPIASSNRSPKLNEFTVVPGSSPKKKGPH